jgi:hypothetical protein
VLAATKTKRSHVVDIDPVTVAVLEQHHRSLTEPPPPDAFEFSDDGGISAWKPNRATKTFLRHRRAAGLCRRSRNPPVGRGGVQVIHHPAFA